MARREAIGCIGRDGADRASNDSEDAPPPKTPTFIPTGQNPFKLAGCLSVLTHFLTHFHSY